MRMPRITTDRLKRLDKVSHALWFTFKLCLPLGVAILVLGTAVAGLRYPQHPEDTVPARVSAAAELVMALGCLALASSFLLEGYIFARGFAKSVRFGISGILANTFGAVVLASGAIILCIMAIRDWLQ